eukprot:COSAG03_NODE_3266_length_2117_cov_93.814668_1_plen_143_part_00
MHSQWRRPTQQELPGLAQSGQSLQAHVEGGHEALCFGQYGRREVDHVVLLCLSRVLRAMHAHVEGHRLAVVKNERAEGEVVGDARVLLAHGDDPGFESVREGLHDQVSNTRRNGWSYRCCCCRPYSYSAGYGAASNSTPSSL